MKFDLTTSIVIGIIGVVAGFFIMDLFLPEIEGISFKSLKSTPNTTLASPNPEVFNYRAINPTVEVYVGQCEEYDATGNCVNNSSSSSEDSAPAEGE